MRASTISRLLAGSLLVLPLLVDSASTEEIAVGGWLSQPFLRTNGFESEVQRFLKNQVPLLQVPDSPAQWEKKSAELRRQILDQVFLRNVPTEWYKNKPQISWGDVIETDKGYRIRKLKYEALPGLWVPALLYEPAKAQGKIPGILNVNGHTSTGKAEEYEQIRCINLAKRGMLALHPEFLGYGELSNADFRHNRMAYLDLCGINGVVVFYLVAKRAIDVLEMCPQTDPARIGMTGLSGGGWQTIMLSSLDTRIAAAAPNAGYIGLACRAEYPADRGDLEQNPSDLLTIADYSHLTALLAPRPALLIYNDHDDCCFSSPRAWPSVFKPVIPFYELFNKTAQFQFHNNLVPGTHNYDQDNRERFYRFIEECFLPTSKRPQSGQKHPEISTAGEILPYTNLVVGLPENNANFFTLARGLISALPQNRPPEFPSGPPAKSQEDKLAKWQAVGRNRLRQVLRLGSMTATAVRAADSFDGQLNATRFEIALKGDGEWTVPAVAFARNALRRSVALVFADKGKAALTEQVQKLLEEGALVVAVDPLFMGECVPQNVRFWKYAQMLSAVGKRPLGLQVGQLGAVVDWACREFKTDKVSLHGIGWNSSIAALCTGALHPAQVEYVSVKEYPASLKLLVENHLDYENNAALFCYGLLEQFDVPELITLCSPLQVKASSSTSKN